MHFRAALTVFSACTALVAGDAPSWKLARVSTTGSHEFTDREIVQASGLTVGSPITVAELSEAANRLSQTGAFKTVSVSYESTAGELAAVFALLDAEGQLPIRYENFVWVEDDELQRYLSTHVALFHGRVSRKGTMVQRVADALGGWLAGRGLPGTVVTRLHSTGEAQAKQEVDSVSYFVSGVPMPVRTVEIVDAPSLDAGERRALERVLVGAEYERTAFLESAMLHLHPFYAKRGMLRAQLGTPRVRLLGPSPAAPELGVSFDVHEGPVCRIAGVEWTRPVAEDLASQIHVAVGAVADTSKLGSQLSAIQKGLEDRGHLRAAARSTLRFSDAGDAVRYVIDVDPGPLFHFGVVRFEGFSKAVEQRLLNGWKLSPKDVYHDDDLQEFLRENSASMAGRSIHIDQSATDANVVNLTIQAH